MIVLDVTKKADITAVSFLDATRLLVTALKKDPYYYRSSQSLWDITTAKPAPGKVVPGFTLGIFGQFRSGDWLLGSTTQGELAAHHPATGRTVIEAMDMKFGCLALTPDGKTVLFQWFAGRLPFQNGYASRTWSDTGAFGPGFRVAAATEDDRSISYYCSGLAALPDGERFVTIEWSTSRLPRLMIRSVSTGDVMASAEIDGRERPVLAVAPDGARLAAAVLGSLFAFPTDDLTRRRRIKNDGRKHFTDLAFHPSGKYLAATSNDETVKLYDTSTWEVARTFTWDIGRMRSIAFSPDGTLAAAGSDSGKVVVWDVDL